MDESEEDEAGETVDVAALMGFGSFGDQHRGKRRRYNGRTEEAVVDGSEPRLETGKGRGNKSSGSGSNNLPLGTGRPRPKKSGAVETEGNEESGNDTPQNATRNERGEQIEDAVRETDGNTPAPESPTRPTARQDSHAPPSPSTDKLAPTPTPKQIPRTTSGGDTSLPPKPPLPSLPHSSGKAQAPTRTGTGMRIGTGIGKGTENEAWKLRKGVRLANGDVAYYDASFVEDPWRGLR